MRFLLDPLRKAGWFFGFAAMVVLPMRGACAADIQNTVTVDAGETVDIGGVTSILVRAKHPNGSILLLTGGDGRLNVMASARFTEGADNVLIRNRDALVNGGYDVLLLELGTNLAAATDYMAKLKRPVVIVATSKGTQRAAEGLAQGARPDKLVLSSGFLSEASGPADSVASLLKSPALLPSTLVIHHRDDRCRWTNPAGVAPFQAWGGKRVEVIWMSGGNDDPENPCRFSAHHGFAGQDKTFVSHILQFIEK
ncbi:hypothetical protein [Dyella kyungheensis]|nr:hypothetical protein [Dyella kyungheensis]